MTHPKPRPPKSQPIPKHFTVAQLDALYARTRQLVHERFIERAAIREFDGGMDALSAANAAHADIIAWIRAEIARLDALDAVDHRAAALILDDMRRRNPAAYEWWRPGGGLDQEIDALEAIEKVKRNDGE